MFWGVCVNCFYFIYVVWFNFKIDVKGNLRVFYSAESTIIPVDVECTDASRTIIEIYPLAYLNGLAGWHDAWTNCFAVTDSGAL